MDREAVTALVLESKRARGLTFGELAEHVGADPVWLTAALLGQHPLTAEQAALVSELLGPARGGGRRARWRSRCAAR